MSSLAARYHRPVFALVAGGLAGFFALGLDELLAFLSLGFAVPLALRHVLAYVALGALAALVLIVAWLPRRQIPDGWLAFAVAAAGIYAPAIFERVHHALNHRVGSLLAIAVAGLVVAGYGLWIVVVARFVGGRFSSLAPMLGAIGAAVGLAVNRNLVNYPLEPAALAADAAVIGGIMGLAYLARRKSAQRALLTLVAVGVVAVAVAVVSRWSPSSPSNSVSRQPPNLVLVIIDTLRQDVFRRVVRKTEEGRAFRKAMVGSAWFNNAVAASPWTVPSVGSIMTGLYPREHGFHASPVKDPSRPLRPLAGSVTTLAQRLQSHGYLTEALGTNPLLQPVSGIARGFEHYEILSGPTVKLPPLTALARLDLLRDDNYQDASSVRRRLRQRLGKMTASGRPIFLWLHLMDPHSPLKSHQGISPDPGVAGFGEMRRLYHDETRFALRELTAMFQLLRDHGLWQNTALVVASDHGEMFPADRHDNGVTTLDRKRPKLYGHGHAMYSELVNVPLVIRPPGGLPEGRRVTALTSHVDLHDTLLDLLGFGVAPGGDRVSLMPWLGDEPAEPRLQGRGHVLVGANQHGPKQRAIRTSRFKLIDYPTNVRPNELYEIANDPRERRDISGTRNDQVMRLQGELESAWGELLEAPSAKPTELDAETLERLKALGYVP